MVPLYLGLVFMVLFILGGLHQIYKKDYGAAYILIMGDLLLLIPITIYYFEVIHGPQCN